MLTLIFCRATGELPPPPPPPPEPEQLVHPSLLPVWLEPMMPDTHDKHKLAVMERQRKAKRRRKDEEELVALGTL